MEEQYLEYKKMAEQDQILTLSLMQTDLVWENVEANISIIECLFHDVPSDCDLLVLPEMFSTGFSMEVGKLAEPMDGSTVAWMISQAASLKVVLAGSLMIRESNNFYNRFLFVYPDGKVEYYDKRHLFSMGNENAQFTAGKVRKVIQINGFRILPQVCYDLRFPVFARNRDDYDLNLNCANWPAPRKEVWMCLLKARAIENQAYAAGVNRVGVDANGIRYSGHSVIYDPRGSLLAEANNSPKILTSKLSINTLRSFRAKFPVLPDADAFSLNG